jgi:hypothetical protein
MSEATNISTAATPPRTSTSIINAIDKMSYARKGLALLMVASQAEGEMDHDHLNWALDCVLDDFDEARTVLDTALDDLRAAGPDVCSLSLSAVAAELGEIDPPGDADMTAEHIEKLERLKRIASMESVRSAKDAALAVSLAASALGEVMDSDLGETERRRRLSRALRTLARVSGWLARDAGADPLASAWPEWALPQ